MKHSHGYPTSPSDRGSRTSTTSDEVSPIAGSVRPVSDAAVLILGADDRCHQSDLLIPRSVHIALGHSNRTRPALRS